MVNASRAGASAIAALAIVVAGYALITGSGELEGTDPALAIGVIVVAAVILLATAGLEVVNRRRG